MEPTIVTGVDRAIGLPYVVTLNGEDTPVLMPDTMHTFMPLTGRLVMSGPVGIEVRFDPDDPAAVYAWLLGSTDVVCIEGPNLLVMPPGDVLADDTVVASSTPAESAPAKASTKGSTS